VRVDCSDFYQKPPTLARRPGTPSPYSCLRPSITYIDSRMAFPIPLYVYVYLSRHFSFSLFVYIGVGILYNYPRTNLHKRAPEAGVGITGEGKIRREKKLSSVKISRKLMPGSSVPGIRYTE